MVKIYIVCREGHSLYEKYLKNLSGDELEVVGVYLAPENTRLENLQYVLGYALVHAQNCGADIVICEDGLADSASEKKCQELGMYFIDLEALFISQILMEVEMRMVAVNFRWFANHITGLQTPKEIIVLDMNLAEYELMGLDSKTVNPRLDLNWVREQLSHVFPVTSIEIVSEPDFIESRMPNLPPTTLLIASSDIWMGKRHITSAMFLPLSSICSTMELVSTNPFAFDFSLAELRLDIEKLFQSA